MSSKKRDEPRQFTRVQEFVDNSAASAASPSYVKFDVVIKMKDEDGKIQNLFSEEFNEDDEKLDDNVDQKAAEPVIEAENTLAMI